MTDAFHVFSTGFAWGAAFAFFAAWIQMYRYRKAQEKRDRDLARLLRGFARSEPESIYEMLDTLAEVLEEIKHT